MESWLKIRCSNISYDQLISRNRQENEPGPYATAEKSLPTEKKKFAIECCLAVTFPLLTYITQKFAQISLNSDFRFHSHCSCIVIYEKPIKLEIEIPQEGVMNLGLGTKKVTDDRLTLDLPELSGHRDVTARPSREI